MTEQSDKLRCPWCVRDDLYMAYHDREWGRPSHDDKHLFEMLLLESFQAGLSWYTILSKRENFRKAFSDFDPVKIAAYTDTDVERLMQDSGIVRNRLKILAAINNAQCFLDIQRAFSGFSNYLWGFSGGGIIDNKPESMSDIPARTAESDRMAKDMKSRGFKFMGSTVCYATMQSIGMVNDHIMSCLCRKQDNMS